MEEFIEFLLNFCHGITMRYPDTGLVIILRTAFGKVQGNHKRRMPINTIDLAIDKFIVDVILVRGYKGPKRIQRPVPVGIDALRPNFHFGHKYRSIGIPEPAS